MPFLPGIWGSSRTYFFKDQNGDTIPCSKQYFNIKDNHVTGFSVDSSLTQAAAPIYHLPWHRKTLDLSAYTGQVVTAHYIAKMCNGNFHCCYMYLDFDCNEQAINAACPGMGNVCAPVQCESYLWTTPLGTHPITPCTPASVTGIYSVKIPAQKMCLSDTTVLSYTVNPNPVANFSSQTSCQSLDYQFMDASTLGPDTACIKRWQMGNASFTGTSINYHFAAAGNHTVTLIALNCDQTCSDTISKVISVAAPLHADFISVPTVCAGKTVSFTNTSSTLLAMNTWDFDFSKTMVLHPVINYNTAGTYPVKLVVKDSLGCKDSIVKTITILPLPVIHILPENICVGVSGYFSGSATGTTTVTKWQWDFQNDGITDSEGMTTQAVYPAQGNFWVKLLATSPMGCVAKDSSLIQVYPRPTAAFMINEQYSPLIRFTNNSTTPGNTTLVSGLWNFGDGAADEDNIVSVVNYTYTQPGRYSVLLTAINNFGCSDTISHPLVVSTDYAIYIPNAFTPNNDGLNDVFKAECFGLKDYRLTVFDRLGAEVFSSKELTEGWDGTVKHGTESKQDVYVWRFEYTKFSGESNYKMGHVTLVK